MHVAIRVVLEMGRRGVQRPPFEITADRGTRTGALDFGLDGPIELRSAETTTGTVTVRGYALYYVCEGVRGRCLYRRRDLEIPIEVVHAAD